MKPGNSPFSTMDHQRPPTPEPDYPEDSPNNVAFPEEDYSPRATHNNYFFPNFQPEKSPTSYDYNVSQPPGWSSEIIDGETVYVHNITQERRVRSIDGCGKFFYRTPDGSESRWNLPQKPLHQRESIGSDSEDSRFAKWTLPKPSFVTRKSSEEPDMPSRRNAFDFTAVSEQEMVFESINRHPKSLDKAGILFKTKIADNGKRLRKKNWTSSWTVLEGSILTFYKDSKNLSANSLKQASNFNTPEYTVELQGASISRAPKEKSSKKNVLELRTRSGSVYLIQHDTDSITDDWYRIILESIQTMSPASLAPPNDHSPEPSPTEKLEANHREKEEKKAYGSGPRSNDLGADNDPSKIRSALKRFLLKRPTMQALRDRGYIKDQVFGCHLHILCEREKTYVPRFVTQCINTVEQRGLDIDGLYRVSGNLATIQKLRFKVDHEENYNLGDGDWDDVHVITGALKLFFRELPEPLFPFSHFDKFINAIKFPDSKAEMKELVDDLPHPNRETMKVLFQHLCKVIDMREENRMSVKSIAIVFGPTLLKKELETGNIATNMVFQTQIVEQILSHYNYIFAGS